MLKITTELSKTQKLFATAIIGLLILNFSHANLLDSRYVPFAIGSFFLFELLLTNQQFSKSFLWLIFGWISINLTSMLINNLEIYLFRIIINSVNLLFLPYLIIKKYGLKFWEIFEKILYFLTLISLPLYILNIIFYDLFLALDPIFSPLTSQAMSLNANYWSIFIYNNSMLDIYYRNLGFMWEPGAFAMLIIWGLVFNSLRTENFAYSKKFWVYTIALITTFSTAGYFAYLVFITGYFLKRFSIINFFSAIIIGSLFYLFVYDLPFISGKLDVYVEGYESDPYGELGYTGRKVNRFQGGVTALLRTIDYPLGVGLVSAEDKDDASFSYGVNGLASLLEMWGVFLFPVLMVLLHKTLKILDFYNIPKFRILFFYTALLVMFFSNPVARMTFIYFIFLTPIAIKSSIGEAT